LLYCAMVSSFLLAQGVGVNETGENPHPSAILDASSTSKGFVPPRMTSVQRDLIEGPVEGLQIFNTTTKCLEMYVSPNWQNVFCGCSSAPVNLNYTDNGPIVYCVNTTIPPNTASSEGSTPGSYSVSPALPVGLLLNNVTGQITGTPIVAMPSASYTVSAVNACGSVSRVLDIEVLAIPLSPAGIVGPEMPTANSNADYSISSVPGAVSYNWNVPEDWMINSGQGTSGISVNVGQISGSVMVTATNTCGTSPASAKAVTAWLPVTAEGGAATTYTANGTNGTNGVHYRVHSFTTVGSASFNVMHAGTDGQVDYLIVGGGGGGGWDAGGGGGGGGVLTGSVSLASGSYPVLVGQGGSGGSASVGAQASDGNPSSFNSINASGGGGAGNKGAPGRSGASGGGGGHNSSSINLAGGTGTPGQGFNGGAGLQNFTGGGGGGSAQHGENGSSSQGGNGGNGYAVNITGNAVHYGGGGGGGNHGGAASGGLGGLGGGGNGGGASQSGSPGTPSTGGGGGSHGNLSATSGPFAGGSGIVIIRYPITNPNP